MAGVASKKLLNLININISQRILIPSQITRQYSRRRTRNTDGNATTDGPKSEAEKLLQDSFVGKSSDFHNPNHMWQSNPYKEHPIKYRDQSKLSDRPDCDPKDTSILLFPGQGSQFVGMGKDLLHYPIVQDLFEAANEVLGYNLTKLCMEGPKEKLDLTRFCQPAVMVTSLAAVEKLKDEKPQAIERCVATAGFSVGELTALVFAGALPYEQALRLVKARAEAMQLASELTPSGMATVIFGPDSKLGFACVEAKEYCLSEGIEQPVCGIANYLYPACKVVAGHEKALEYLEQNASKYKLRRVRRLPVSGAFHTELMRPAVDPFKAALKKAHICTPLVSVHSNVDAKRYRDAEHILHQLPKQIFKPVRWEQVLHALYERAQGEHFPNTYECGPGRSLKTILKMVNAKAFDSTTCISV